MNDERYMPPEVMLGENVAKPVLALAKPAAKMVAPDIWELDGRLHTRFAEPSTANSADMAMERRDLRLADAEDDPVASHLRNVRVVGFDPGAPSGDSTVFVSGRQCGKSQAESLQEEFDAEFRVWQDKRGAQRALTEQLNQQREAISRAKLAEKIDAHREAIRRAKLAEKIDAHREAIRRAKPGPYFRVTRNGISTSLTAPELTDGEVQGFVGARLESVEHARALYVEQERMATFIEVPTGVVGVRWQTSLRQATDDQLRAYGNTRMSTTVLGWWSAECKRRGLDVRNLDTPVLKGDWGIVDCEMAWPAAATAPSDAEVRDYFKRSALGRLGPGEHDAMATRLKLRTKS